MNFSPDTFNLNKLVSFKQPEQVGYQLKLLIASSLVLNDSNTPHILVPFNKENTFTQMNGFQ